MPVVRPPQQPYPELRSELVSRLADELAKDPVTEVRGDPLIFENPIQPTNRVFVVVVWSEWGRVAWGERPGIITDAYRQYAERTPNPVTKPEQIATAVGMTWDEADYNAFFKYAIHPNPRQGEVNFDQVRNAMLDEGGVPTPFGVKLRFVSREEAERVYKRLNDRLPAAHWSLAEIRRAS